MDLFNFIKQQLPILDIISGHVNLKQIGSYWKGSCPFHAETDASFTVSPDRQIFYCFGCQATGDVISFIAKLENISQIEAAKILIDQHQIIVPKEIEKNAFISHNTILKDGVTRFDVCLYFAQWTHQELLKNHIALDYLQARNISLEQINHFLLGYFASGVNTINRLVKDMAKHNILLNDLITTGIIAESKGVLYSGFEQRILFPIKDQLSRCCGFGGRIFKPTDQRAKYYNSRDSEIFSKSKLLFGFDIAKKSMQEKQYVFLVEGYFDCISMVQHGWENTVATLGTACTLEHLKLLSRYVNSLYLIYDGDKAGVAAILRIAQLCWDVNLDIYVVTLPDKDDPDSFLKKSGDLQFHVDKAKGIFSFFIQEIAIGFVHKSLSEKMTTARKVVELVAKVQDVFKRDVLLQKAAFEMQISFDAIKSLLREVVMKPTYSNQKNYNKKSLLQDQDKLLQSEESLQDVVYSDATLLEEKIFSAILNSTNSPDRLYIDPEILEYFPVKIRHLLERLIVVSEQYNQEDVFDTYLEQLDEQDKKWVLQACLKFDVVVSQEVFQQLLFHFYKSNWKYIINDIKKKMQVARQEKDSEKQKVLMERFLKFKKDMQTRGLV